MWPFSWEKKNKCAKKKGLKKESLLLLYLRNYSKLYFATFVL